jgi:hypothetical protein
MEQFNLAKRLLGRARFTDRFHVMPVVDQRHQTQAHQGMVVHQKDTDFIVRHQYFLDRSQLLDSSFILNRDFEVDPRSSPPPAFYFQPTSKQPGAFLHVSQAEPLTRRFR